MSLKKFFALRGTAKIFFNPLAEGAATIGPVAGLDKRELLHGHGWQAHSHERVRYHHFLLWETKGDSNDGNDTETV